MLSVIIPANNEEALIGACLEGLLASDPVSGVVQVIVAANGCTDRTAEVCRSYDAKFAEKGWGLLVMSLPEGGKLGALTAADASASGDLRAYVDADVVVSPGLIAGLVRALRREEAAYASGRVNITAKGWFSRQYARLWSKVPFMSTGVPGCGVFAVNAEGRARWGAWPQIISDDTFVRLQFTPAERHLVSATYDWPIAEGFARLVRVRRRQDTGVEEVRDNWPDVIINDGTPALGAKGYARLALRDPVGFAAYAAVALAVKIRGPEREWSRSR